MRDILDIIRAIFILLSIIGMFVCQYTEDIYAEVSFGILALFLLITHLERGNK